jgi:hypothetical protein
MAFDLLFGPTRRFFSMRKDLAEAPSAPSLPPSPSKLSAAAAQALAADKDLTIRPRGKGAVVTKQWRW